MAMRQEAEEEKQLMRRENQLLKKTLGLVQTHQRPQGQSARGSAEAALKGASILKPEADLVQPGEGV